MRIMKDGKNMMTCEDGRLSETALKSIAGLMELAPSITAFGNANPTSYLRLVPHQEAPTNVCWGDRNRSVLVRVPLGWTTSKPMYSQINPGLAPEDLKCPSAKQTIEIRSADCSADIYQLLSALSIACLHGLSKEDALETARRTYVDVDIHKQENAGRTAALAQLPDSCAASAAQLERQRNVYEADGVFHPAMTDSIIARLKAFDDADLRQKMKKNPEIEAELVRRFYYC